MTRAIDWILCSFTGNKDAGRLSVKILRQSLKAACTLAMVAIPVSRGYADTPASQVYQQTVQPTQTYPEVAANGEGWFDVGGFCKVVDVGDLSSMSPPASGVPVFVPGPTDQWENYRTSAPADAGYNGRLTLTTCCRPQSGIATLCTEAGAAPVSVSRQYGKLAETDLVSATCVDQWGAQYTDSVSLTCQGNNGPDGQAQWAEAGGDTTSNCTPNANITYGGCNASCDGGNLYETVQNSCGQITAQGYIGPSCNTQSCVPPAPPPPTPVYGVWDVTSVVIGNCGLPSNNGQGGIPSGQDINGLSCPIGAPNRSISYSQSGIGVGCYPPYNYLGVTNYYQCESTRGYYWTQIGGANASCTDHPESSSGQLPGSQCFSPGTVEILVISAYSGGGACPVYETSFVPLECE